MDRPWEVESKKVEAAVLDRPLVDSMWFGMLVLGGAFEVDSMRMDGVEFDTSLEVGSMGSDVVVLDRP